LDINILEEKVKEIGFDLFGISKTLISQRDRDNFKEFIDKGFYGSMNWFQDRQDIRNHFSNLGFLPKSAICLGVLYNSSTYKSIMNRSHLRISRYAIGKDYHKVIRKMGKKLIIFLRENFPNYHFRQSVDTLPISEKVLSASAGLGWIGKNTNLISTRLGSYFFLSVILTDYEFKTFEPGVDRCGKCTKCIDACPTNALIEPYKIDARLCISYLTIESRDPEIPKELSSKLNGWVYGCDICQEVCPWNMKAEKSNIFSSLDDFKPLEIFTKSDDYLVNISEDEFNKFKKDSAISRISYKQWKRNIYYNLKYDKPSPS
jgi:epoxyqueuosine reductase